MVQCEANNLKARKRNYAPKVKSGCKTCKIRRVKCDEAKPSCYRCDSTGRRCDGYEAPTTKEDGLVTQKVLLLPKQDISLFADGLEEGYVLDLFNNRTGPRIQGFLDRSFWSRVVIQLGHNEPAIRNAMKAVCAVYEQVEFLGGEVASMNQSAIQSYNKAIRLVVRESASSDSRLYIPLVVCALFVCLEFLRGNHGAATVHIQGGISMLNDWRRKTTLPSPPESPETSEASVISTLATSSELELMEDLTSVFARLRLQSGVRGKVPLMQKIPGDDTMPPKYYFRTMSEARDEGVKLMNKSIDLITTTSPAKYADTVTAEMVARQSWLEARFLDWKRAMEDFLKREENNLLSMEFKGAQVMVLHSTCCLIWTSTCLSPEESQYDKYKEQFEEIANKIADIADLSPEFLCTHVGRFHYDMGLVAPLHLIGSRCRWPHVRQICLKILASYRWREGMFDSYKSYRYIKAIMELEEAEKIRLLGLEPSESEDYLPPEGARIHFSEMGPVDPVSGRQVYTFFTKRYGPQGDWYMQRKSVSSSSESPERDLPEKDVLMAPHISALLGKGPEIVPETASTKTGTYGMFYYQIVGPEMYPPGTAPEPEAAFGNLPRPESVLGIWD